MTLYQVLRELQIVLALILGACPLCRQPVTPGRLAPPSPRPNKVLLGAMDEQSASRVTDDMVTRSSRALWLEVNPEYQADIRRFTDADIAAGKLREADDAATAANRAIVRRVLEAAFLLLPDDVRELLGEIRVTPDK